MRDLVKIGARVGFDVEGKRIEGEVLTYYGDKKNKGRYVLSVRDDEGRIHCLRAQTVGSGLTVQGFTVDVAAAETIARAHLQGERTNLPIEQQLNILAGAVLQLRTAQ
jgi:hypothetical protein